MNENQETQSMAADARHSSPTLGSQTVTVFDEAFPLMKSLGDGWHLIAHQNGPAITLEGADMMVCPSIEDEDVPERVRSAAIDAITKLAWPLLKERYHPANAKERDEG